MDEHLSTTSPEGHDQHILYVDVVEGRRGETYQVVGSLAEGFEFKCLFKMLHPERFAHTRSMKHVGWVEQSKIFILRGRLESILPPGRQVAFGNLIVPLERVRTSQT